MTVLRYFFIGVSFIFLSGLNVAEAQWNFSELVNRLSQEKSKVVSYRLIITQTPEEGSAARFAKCTWIEEFSAVGDHNVVAIVQQDAKGNAAFWGVGGRSDDVWINGSSDKGTIGAVPFDRVSSVKIPSKLDWRILGLGFCGDIGDSFETVGKNIASWDKTFSGATFTNTKTGVKMVFFDISLEAEIADGLRITSFTRGDTTSSKKDSNLSDWRVEYKKQFGQVLPSSASLHCGDSVVNYELVWESVNKPLELGIATAERFQQAMKKLNVKSPTR